MANLVEYEGKKVQCPETWNELNKKQLITIAEHWPKTMLIKEEKELEKAYYRAKVIILRVLIEMKPHIYAKLTLDQVASMLPLMDFLNQPPDLDKQLIPYFTIRGKKYIGPEAGLKKSNFDEFIKADTIFMKITKGDFSLIDQMVATLYRPKLGLFQIDELKRQNKYIGDKRVPYNDQVISDLAEFYKDNLADRYKWAVFYFYWGFRNKHVIVFENLFEKKNPETKETGNNYGWGGTLLELSGEKFGPLTETSKTNWFTIFVEMSRRSDLAMKQKQKQQEMENKRRAQSKRRAPSRRR